MIHSHIHNKEGSFVLIHKRDFKFACMERIARGQGYTTFGTVVRHLYDADDGRPLYEIIWRTVVGGGSTREVEDAERIERTHISVGQGG
jgi:hypothetical protein